MKRRDSIKTLITAAGGLVTLPAWADGWTSAILPEPSSAFDLSGQETIAAIADAIIPKGDAIGALSVGVDKFLVALLENCYEKDVQDNVSRQLAALNTQAQEKHQKAFGSCSEAQRQAMLLSLASSSDKQQEDFFQLMKSETIRGFNTSKEVMLGYLKYKVVPGHYYGCVDATT